MQPALYPMRVEAHASNSQSTPASYIAAHIADHTDYREQARAHFPALFGDQCGWLELSSIEGDPDDRQRRRFHQSWFDYTPDRLEALIKRTAELAKKYGNVYTSITLYREPKRDKAQALPGRVVFVDDAPPGSYTYTLKTSPDREQAFIILDQAADVASREAIARRFSRTADRSGWDITQLARVPGTFNTKARAGGRYGRGPRDWVAGSGHRVTLIPRTLRTYTLAELGKTAPKVEHDEAGPMADLDWPEVERWRGNLAPLMDAAGMPRRWKAHQQAYRVLSGEVVPVNHHGEADESTRRSFLARGCAWARYPHDAAAAILWQHTSGSYISRKGSQWHKDDIARVIAREYAIVAQKTASYQVRPITAAELRHGSTNASMPIEPIARTSRARHDRPQRYTAATLFAHYRDTPTICTQARKQRAAALDISTATLDRLEKELRVLGLIEIECAGRGHCGHVALMGVINIADDGVLSADANETADLGAATPQTAESVTQCMGETHPPGAVSLSPAAPAACLSLVEAVRQAFDLVRVDQTTGERQRITRKRLLAALDEMGAELSPAKLDAAIADERQRRRIAAIVADIRTMKRPTLRAQLRLMERLSDKSRAEGTNLHKFSDWAARELRQALASLPSTGRKPRPICEALPDLRAASAAHRAQQEEREQAELWAVADRELSRRLPTAPRAATRAGVCSPQPTPAELPDYSAAARTIAMRLRQRGAALFG